LFSEVCRAFTAMTRNKPRLELALYARPKHPGTHHYALFVSPKSTKSKVSASSTKHHVKNTLQNIHGELSQPWRYECVAIPDCNVEQRLLARVVIAKVVVPIGDLEKTLTAVPVYQEDDVEVVDGRVFSCRTWVRDALEELGKQGVIVGLTDWEHVQRRALDYVESKRKVGRWDVTWGGERGVPMTDLLSGEELIR